MSYLFDGINHPTVAQVQAAGAIGALLYAGTPADSLGKDFAAAQYADYKAHGLVVGLVYESVSGDFLGGAAAGTAHARDFWNDCAAKGAHTTDPAGSTVDQHVTTAQIPTVVAYQRAFRDELRALGWTGPIGVYGFSETLIACHSNGVADWFWGAGSRSALPPYTNVWQDNTGTILIGGSSDDRDWVLIPLPGGTMPVLDSTDLANVGQAVATALINFRVPGPDGAPRNLWDSAYQERADEITAAKALTADQSALLAAIHTGVDIPTLAAALAPVLAPLLPASTSPAVVGEAVVAALESHLAASTGGTA